MKIFSNSTCICFSVAALFALSACNNDLVLFDEIIESPVIYSLLAVSDTAHYVRLERTFADETRSAVELAQDENAVFYQDVTVELIDENDVRFVLNRINAVDDGYVRKPGDFLTDPNVLYKINADDINLRPNETYDVEIKREDDILASSSTVVLEDSRIRIPVLTNGARRLSFSLTQPTPIGWFKVESASSYAISFDFVIRERNLNTGVNEDIMLRWDATSLIDETGSGSSQTADLDGTSFYQFLSSRLDVDPNINRQMINISLRITSYGSEIGAYLDIINANAGITSAQEVPVFTNVEDGFGLFSSINETVAQGVSLTNASLEELYDGDITDALNFTP